MARIDYGVVLQDGRWRLIGRNLRYGSYASRARAERAARELALQCVGLSVDVHVQIETGELLPPQHVVAGDAAGPSGV